MKQRNKGTKSIIVILYIIMLVVLITVFGILLMSYNYNRKLAYDCLVDKTELYTEMLEREIVNISRDLKMVQVNSSDLIKQIPYQATPQDGKYYNLWKALKEINSNEEARYDYKYSFFEYGYHADILIMKETVYFKNTSRSELISEMVERLRYKCEKNLENVTWEYVRDKDADYLLSSVQTEGRIVGCLLKMDNLLKDFHVTNLGYEGFVLFEKEGEIYSSADTKGRKEIQNILPKIKESASDYTKDYAWYTYDLRGVGDVKMVTLLSDGVLEKVSIFQSIVTVAFVVIVGIVVYMIWYFYKKVLEPMRKFVVQLQNPDISVCLNEKNETELLELVYASDKFKQMYRELQMLRIDLYEKELFEKSTMLEYAQEQMKPHFFLNCMSTVQSLAELHHAEDIIHILDVLSKYMRYVLKDSFKMRRLSDELDHLNDYMEIQALLKPNMFQYEAVVDGELQDYRIMPLVLQAFVENSVKHGLREGDCVEISLYITTIDMEDGRYLYIVISDTGNGFAEDVLDKIRNEEIIIYNGCEHIGIKNTIQRIKMRYGDRAKVALSNMRGNQGAVVEITLPFEENLYSRRD